MYTSLIALILIIIYFPSVRSWLAGRLPPVRSAIAQWKLRRKIAKQERARTQQAEYLIKQAKFNVQQDAYNPFDLVLISAAIDYYQRSYLLVQQDSCIQAIESLELEIDRRRQFQALFRAATEHLHHKRFSAASADLAAAQELYSPPQLLQTIAQIELEHDREAAYLQSLAEAKTLSYAGKFRDALTIVNAAVAKFTREDGETLQFRLNRVIAAKEQLTSGKIEQRLGNHSAAKSHYLAALTLLPDWSEPKIQLATIAAQTSVTSDDLDRLATIDSPRAKCLAGLLYSQRQEYQKAREVWSKVDRTLVREYWRVISDMTQEQQKLVQPQIQQLVLAGELEQAKTVSLEFINKVGNNLLIETNLRECILPGLEAKIWQTADWAEIVAFTHANWLTNLDITSLHNWAISLYYASQIDDRLEDLIVAWSTAIANVAIDPAIQDLPWLGTKSLSPEEMRTKLWQILDRRIEATKDADLPKYLYLRDRYRQEFWAMEFAQTDPAAKLVIGELIIPPAAYQHYYNHTSFGAEPQLWQALYTNWGTAVAACLAGDSHRAQELQVNLDVVNSKLERFAERFIFYERGCNSLQQANWRSSTYPLGCAKVAIQANQTWQERVDELCAKQRLKIEDFEEHLKFSRFWYDLLSSPRSETYLVEYRALKIHTDWYNGTLNDDLSLIKIKDLLTDYPEHPVVQDTFTYIYEYWQNNQ